MGIPRTTACSTTSVSGWSTCGSTWSRSTRTPTSAESSPAEPSRSSRRSGDRGRPDDGVAQVEHGALAGRDTTGRGVELDVQLVAGNLGPARVHLAVGAKLDPAGERLRGRVDG